MKNPYIFFPVMIALLIAGILIGKNWSKIKNSFSGAITPADGTPCATGGFVGGNNGVYKNGVCTTSGGANPNNSASI